MTSPQEPALKPEELLPCPFCGCTELHAFEYSHGDVSFGFQCTGCWISGPQHETRAEATSAWNTRTVPPAAAPVGELREALENERAYSLALQKALTGLTRQGSEFFVRHGDGFRADIPACLADVRERRDAKERQLRKALAAAPVTGDRETAGVELVAFDKRAAAAATAQGWSLEMEHHLFVAGARWATLVEQKKGAALEALMRLERASSEVSRLGAQTGTQWTVLSSALISARAVVKDALATPPSGGGDHAGGEGETACRHGVTSGCDFCAMDEKAARATAAPAAGVEEKIDAESIGDIIRDSCWVDGANIDEASLAGVSVAAENILFALAASPKAQGSDVGLREALAALVDITVQWESTPDDDDDDAEGWCSMADRKRSRAQMTLAQLGYGIDWSAVGKGERDPLKLLCPLAASRTGQKGAGE